MTNRDLSDPIDSFDGCPTTIWVDIKDSKDLVLSGFRKAHISETVTEAANLALLCENPFQEIEVLVNTSLRTLILPVYIPFY